MTNYASLSMQTCIQTLSSWYLKTIKTLFIFASTSLHIEKLAANSIVFGDNSLVHSNKIESF